MKTLTPTFAGVMTLALMSLTTQAADKVQLEGAKVGHWTMDYDAAVKLAAQKKLPLMLNFTGSDWCGWCKLMDENVFAKPEWQKFAAQNAILVTLDFPKDKSIVPEKYVSRNEQLKNQFKVEGYPTYVILESDGKTQIGQLGAGQDKTPKSFIAEFQGVIKTSPAGIAAYIKENPSKATAFKKAIAEVEASKKELMDWIATRPERNEANTKKFEQFQKQIQAATDKLAAF